MGVALLGGVVNVIDVGVASTVPSGFWITGVASICPRLAEPESEPVFGKVELMFCSVPDVSISALLMDMAVVGLIHASLD